MWVTPDDLYVVAAQNATVDHSDSFLKNQPDSMWYMYNRDTSLEASRIFNARR